MITKKHALKLSLYLLLTNGFIYLIFSFHQWSLNPSSWTESTRGATATLFGIITGFILFFSMLISVKLDDDA